MGDSTEEMLNVTMKRLEYIMDNVEAEKALQAEAHNLIEAAIVLLKMNTEEIEPEKAFEYWGDLQGWTKDLYIASLKMSRGKPQAGQFHLSGKLMTMIVLSKVSRKRIAHYMEELEEADAEKPRQPSLQSLAKLKDCDP